MLWIEPYYRIWNGRLQPVRGHWRSFPNRNPLLPVMLALAR